jgi:hypothetical protein
LWYIIENVLNVVVAVVADSTTRVGSQTTAAEEASLLETTDSTTMFGWLLLLVVVMKNIHNHQQTLVKLDGYWCHNARQYNKTVDTARSTVGSVVGSSQAAASTRRVVIA